MRLLLAIIVSLAALWGGYWYIGASQTETSVRRWMDDRAAEGWVANYTKVKTIGFPSRFDTTITAPELADPDTGLAWSGPFLQILSLSYTPNHVVLAWPDTQTLSTPQETISVTSDGLRGSVRLLPSETLALERATIETGAMSLRSTAGWVSDMASGQLALRQTPAQALSYDVSVQIADLAPPAQWTNPVTGSGLSAPDLGQVQIQASVVFDAPWDLNALETARPQPTRIDIDRAMATWGALELQLGGAVDVDAQGRMTGDVTIRATNWQAMLNVAVETGALPRDVADLMRGGLTLLARLSGNSRSIDAPLTLRQGNMVLGGVLPLGPAPRLVLR